MGNIKFIVKKRNMVRELKTLDDYTAVLKEDKLVVIDFTATWCPPCQFIKPKYHALSDGGEHPNVIFCACDVDANGQTSEKAGIQCMPTFQFYKGGNKVDQIEGADYDTLVAKVKQHS